MSMASISSSQFLMQLLLDLLTSSSREGDPVVNIPLSRSHAHIQSKQRRFNPGQRSGEAGPLCFCWNVERASG